MFDAYEEASAAIRRALHPRDGRRRQLLLGRRSQGDVGRAAATTIPRSTCRRAWPPIREIVYKALFRHYRPTKPIIAAVEGVAIAGGTEILQAMEIRVAGESARFGVSEARWSLYPMARLGGAPAAPDPVHARGRDPADRQAPHARARRWRSGSSGTSCRTARRWPRRARSPTVICANGPLAVEAITRTLHECDGMELDAGAAPRVELRPGGLRQRGREGRPARVRREAQAQSSTAMSGEGTSSRRRRRAARRAEPEWQRAFAWVEATVGGRIVRAERQPRWRPAWNFDVERDGRIAAAALPRRAHRARRVPARAREGRAGAARARGHPRAARARLLPRSARAS